MVILLFPPYCTNSLQIWSNKRKHLKRREMSSDDEKRETVQFPWLLAEMDGE